jgi:hypothetical protein
VYKEISKGRVEIEDSLTEKEVNELANYKGLEVIQFSKPIEDSTFEILDGTLFSVRNDVTLRAYGFYSSDCDLNFLLSMPNLDSFYVECHGEVKNLDNIAALKNLKELNVSIFSLDNFNILSKVPDTLEILILGQTRSKKPDLEAINRFSKLTTLHIEGHTKNIEVIKHLTNIEDLTLRSITTKNLDFLTQLEKMWSLDIKLGGINDFSAIEGMDNIKYLELWQIRGLKDISFISTLKGLQNLFLQSLPNIEVMPSLKELVRLKKVALENMKGLKDISSLEHAPSLVEFTHWSAMNMSVENYIPLLRNPSLKRASVGFGSDKRNKQFQELAAKYNKIDDIWWDKFLYE